MPFFGAIYTVGSDGLLVLRATARHEVAQAVAMPTGLVGAGQLHLELRLSPLERQALRVALHFPQDWRLVANRIEGGQTLRLWHGSPGADGDIFPILRLRVDVGGQVALEISASTGELVEEAPGKARTCD